MASPQLEKGFVRVANELLRALARAEIRGSEFMIILAIIGRTYGYNKVKDQISFKDLEILTGIARPNCARVVKNLVKMNMIGVIKGDNTKASTYWIQKDYDKWEIEKGVIKWGVLSKSNKSVISVDTTPVISIDNTGVISPIIINNKDNHKDTIKDTKDIPKAGRVFDFEVEFEKRWLKYPNKDGKKHALRHFKASVKNAIDLLNIDIAMENYLKSEKVKRGFIKDGSTWFYNWQDWTKPSPEMMGKAQDGLSESQIDTMIRKDLGNLATKEMIMKVMRQIPRETWHRIDDFLHRRYPGGGDGYRKAFEAMRAMPGEKEQVNNEGLEKLKGLTKVAAGETSPWE